MGLKILCAGGSKEEKEAVESAVRTGIGPRPPGESWTVSLVKIGRQWSVTLDGPDKTSPRATFMAAEHGLRAAISDSMTRRAPARGGAAPPVPAARSAASGGATYLSGPSGQRRNAYTCQKCGQSFVVTYEVEAGEGEETVPAACPHCWQIEQVKVGSTAAVNNDYRVEKS